MTLASLLVLVSIPLDLVPLLRGPAPYPPEWQWAFRADGPARLLVAAAACALALLVLLAVSGGARAVRHPNATCRILVAGAVLLGFLLQLALLGREPGPILGTLLSRARSRSFTSYHTVAISPEARDPLAFVRSHAARLHELGRSAKHAATHPPGPVLYYRAALAVCESSSSLTNALLGAAEVPDQEFRPPATRAARAAALLGALLLALMGALTAWPIARLGMALGVEAIPAGRLAALWALLPGPALMTPQFDQALALPVVLVTALLLAGSRETGAWKAAVAGMLGGAAIFTSYGAVIFLAIGGAGALAASGAGLVRRSALLAGLAGGVAALTAFGLPALLGHHPITALETALFIHREAFTAPRSFVLWLLFNPLDLAVFLGVPVALAGCLFLSRWMGRGKRRRELSPIDRFGLAIFAGVGLLVLLGVTRGEVGRLWIPLMPLLLIASLAGPTAPRRTDALLQGTLLAAFTLTMGSYWIL